MFYLTIGFVAISRTNRTKNDLDEEKNRERKTKQQTFVVEQNWHRRERENWLISIVVTHYHLIYEEPTFFRLFNDCFIFNFANRHVFLFGTCLRHFKLQSKRKFFIWKQSIRIWAIGDRLWCGNQRQMVEQMTPEIPKSQSTIRIYYSCIVRVNDRYKWFLLKVICKPLVIQVVQQTSQPHSDEKEENRNKKKDHQKISQLWHRHSFHSQLIESERKHAEGNSYSFRNRNGIRRIHIYMF